MNLATVDIAILVIYAIGIFVLAQWVSREKGSHQKDAQDYFLASRALPWWAIGTSLIAANISAEQIVGMSGSGYVMGMAIASYEWMAALTLIDVGKWIRLLRRQDVQRRPLACWIVHRVTRRVCKGRRSVGGAGEPEAGFGLSLRRGPGDPGARLWARRSSCRRNPRDCCLWRIRIRDRPNRGAGG